MRIMKAPRLGSISVHRNNMEWMPVFKIKNKKYKSTDMKNMKIGIVGTGSIGSILAERLSQAGHHIKVTNTRAMPELEKIAASLGATAASIQDVVKDVDAIIFSMPFNAYKDLPKDLLKPVPQDVVVMDTSNY